MAQDKEKIIGIDGNEIKIEKSFLETVKYGKYITHSLFGTTAQTATNYGIIFVARHPIEIMIIS